MAGINWIKMMVGMFDGMSFKKIKRASIGGESFRDKLTAVWFEIMALVGRCNNGGGLVDSSGMPLTNMDIAVQIDRDEEELRLCMDFYVREGMITIENDVYYLTNWSIYQNIDGMEKIREQTRLRVAKCRERKRLQTGNVTGNATVMLGNDIEVEAELENKESELTSKRTNETPFPLPSVSVGFPEEDDTIRRPLGGELGKGVVLLSNQQQIDLLNRLSLEEFDHYVRVVADCILKGKTFTRKTHYQAILEMATADRKLHEDNQVGR